MTDELGEPRENGAPDPEWGLGATADPVAFGEAMGALGRQDAELWQGSGI